MNTAQQVHVLCELGNAALQSSDTDSMASDQDFKKPDLPGIGARRIKSDEAEIPDEAANKVQDITPEVKNPVIEKQIPLQYKEPSWSGRPSSAYKIEVLKSGVILETIDLHEKNYHVIGRLPICDISLAHPTISRYHAILQYRQVDDEKNSKGLYLYDLDSTHGTFWNGYRVRPNTYVKLQGGHIIRFGCSQRKFIVQTPEEDIQQESELTITELKEKRQTELLQRQQLEKERQQRQEMEEENGIDWGMGEDADEETDLTENPYACTNNEELFLDDPKKTLRGWFEREGHELTYQTEEKGIGQFLCWVDLPIDTSTGRSVRAESLVKGKKKESVIQCALEACRILDRHGVLRQATHEARKRKTRNWEEQDFYDSDDDNFLDRTGSVEKKREHRMRQAGKFQQKVETYASLLEQHSTTVKKIADMENELRKSQKLTEEEENSNEDALDAFMSSLSATSLNKADIKKIKIELINLRKEEERLLRLVNMTKPASLPSLTSQPTSNENHQSEHRTETKSNSNPARTSPSENPNCKTHKDDKAAKKESAQVNFATHSGAESSIATDIDESNVLRKKKKNMKRMQQRNEKASKEISKGYDNETYDEDYSMWLPPQNQSGDGKTNLNEKYGY